MLAARPTACATSIIQNVKRAVWWVPFAFLLACWFVVGCATSTTPQRTSDGGGSDTLGGSALDQLPHLIVALRVYYENMHRWPENPQRLADFVHENRRQWPEHWHEPGACIQGNPNRFEIASFRELTFQPRSDGKLSVHFVFDLPLPNSASGILTVEQPNK